MSKKKAGANTMTLKDFHGGSIPSDLPLPSAPGVVPRSIDRPGNDRASWGCPMGRSDPKTRPNSSPSIRHIDDKTPFLTHTANLGRVFDEDERKPLSGLSVPRRTVSDDSFRVLSSRLEVKLEPFSTGRVTAWQGSAPSGGGSSSYLPHSGINTQMVGGNGEKLVPGAFPNAWGVKKEVAVGGNDPVQSAWAGQTAVSKLVNASAVEKVSSGRWQPRGSLPSDSDVDGIKHSVPEVGRSKNYDNMFVRGRESSDLMLARRMERGLNIQGVEGKAATYSDGHLTTCSDGKFSGTKMQPVVPSEVSERPKLKLQPRTKPIENIESPANKPKKEQQSDISNILHRNVAPLKGGLAGNQSVNQPVEHPKLNLMPQCQLLEHSEGNPEREGNAVFAGARPRELVLKERGIDDTKIHEPVQQSDRVKPSVPKAESVPSQPIRSPEGENPETGHRDVRTVRKFEKDNRGDADRSEFQRRNWRSNENKRTNNRGKGRPQPLIQERHPSPETWRKPIERLKPASPDGSGLRFGKAASAVELAQAFSKPCSDPKGDERFNMQRGVPSRSGVPFSRLTSPTPRKINGY